MVYIFLAVLGASMGSFVGALSWRLKHGMDFVSDRSICEHCKHVLAWQDLVPVFSWLVLRGKCRYCSKDIGRHALLLELSGALLFMLSFWAWPFVLDSNLAYLLLGTWLVLLVMLMALFVYDLKWMQLPNNLIWVLAGSVAAFRLIEIFSGETVFTDTVRASALGLAVGGGFFYMLFQFSKGKWIGGGDVKLGFVMGALLGPAKAAVGLLVGFYAAAIVVLPLMAIGRVGRKAQIPFGPFLIIGFFIAFFWGDEIRQTYLDFAGIE